MRCRSEYCKIISVLNKKATARTIKFNQSNAYGEKNIIPASVERLLLATKITIELRYRRARSSRAEGASGGELPRFRESSPCGQQGKWGKDTRRVGWQEHDCLHADVQNSRESQRLQCLACVFPRHPRGGPAGREQSLARLPHSRRRPEPTRIAGE